jgi:hypothetical protein
LAKNTGQSGLGGFAMKIIKRIAAAGDKNNDQITNCRICSSNGWPREPITFEKVNGRMLSTGGNEVKRWMVRDYFTGNIHEHKSAREESY